jgi:hypothetical protein
MRAVHQGLGITAEDWDAFIGIITRTLVEIGVTTALQTDRLGIFEERLRPTVVTR